jgi:predicted nucleic acid-binding protein
MSHDPLFLDTAYVLALVNTRDQWHEAAVQWEQLLSGERTRLLTTEFVLLEIADGLARIRFRSHAVRILQALRANPLVQVVPVSSALLNDALALFQDRPDKEWGLTDCTSFIVMEQQRVGSALTSDVHFVQAGFKALLLESLTTS